MTISASSPLFPEPLHYSCKRLGNPGGSQLSLQEGLTEAQSSQLAPSAPQSEWEWCLAACSDSSLPPIATSNASWWDRKAGFWTMPCKPGLC